MTGRSTQRNLEQHVDAFPTVTERGAVVLKTRDGMIFAAAGIALIACQAWLVVATRGLTHSNGAQLAAVLPLILGLAVPTGLLLVAAPRIVSIPVSRAAMIVLLAVGALMRLVWFGTPPPLEDDFFRYLWDGAVVAHGLDPYAYAPAEFTGQNQTPAAYARIADGAQATLRGINFPEMRTIYPSVAQAAFALAHLIAPFKVDGLRLVFFAGELVTLWLLVEMLGRLGQSPLWSLLYWWNPLVAFMLVGIAHVDALIPPFVLGAVLALSAGGSFTALALIGLGAGVKVWPVLLSALVLWPLLRTPMRLAQASLWLAVVLAFAVGPVLVSALRPGSGLSAYAGGWSNNNAPFAWLLYAFYSVSGSVETAERTLRPMLAIATGVIALVMAARGDATLNSLASRALVVAAAMFYLSPAQFPWYAVWFLPLAVLCRSWPLLMASALLPTYYLFFPLWPVWNGVWFFYGTAFMHSVPVLCGLVYVWYRAKMNANQPEKAAQR
jgi:alpha-1,6-mannosyltransferase